MITYNKGWGGLLLVCRIVGTSWPYGITPGLISVTIGLVLTYWPAMEEFISDDDRFMQNHYPFQLFAYLVGFFMVFRTNFAYRRYWLSLDAVQRMSSKWLDGALMCIAFDAPGSKDHPYLHPAIGGESGAKATDSADAASGPAGMSHSEFYTQTCHLFSLLHALALQHLRGDKNLDNLQEVATDVIQPTLTVIGRVQGDPSSNVVSGWLHFSERSLETKRRNMKLNVIGSVSDSEKQVLTGDSRGKAHLGEARVTMVCGWVIRRMIARQKHEPMGDMSKTSPPILSRIYQVVSDGMLAFSQATMAATVPFPFPYQNLTQTFLWVFVFTVPFVINAKIENVPFRILVNFCAVWSYFSLSAVGDNLEDPYLPYDPNDLPLTVMQHNFNEQLVAFGVVPDNPPSCEALSRQMSPSDDTSKATLDQPSSTQAPATLSGPVAPPTASGAPTAADDPGAGPTPAAAAPVPVAPAAGTVAGSSSSGGGG